MIDGFKCVNKLNRQCALPYFDSFRNLIFDFKSYQLSENHLTPACFIYADQSCTLGQNLILPLMSVVAMGKKQKRFINSKNPENIKLCNIDNSVKVLKRLNKRDFQTIARAFYRLLVTADIFKFYYIL